MINNDGLQQDPTSKMQELLERLIHIELKVDELLRGNVNSEISLKGHPDQFFGGRTYSQHGEDLVIASIFKRLQIENPDYIDIGAHHPVNISNTALLYQLGSRGINIEANPILFLEFPKFRPDDINLNIGISDADGELEFYMIDERSGRNTFSREVANSFIEEFPRFSIQDVRKIPVTTVNHVLERYYASRCPKFLSIDIEGFDLICLQNIDFSRYRPIVICAEVDFAGRKNEHDSIVHLLRARGYIPFYHAISNIIFVDQKSYDKLGTFDYE